MHNFYLMIASLLALSACHSGYIKAGATKSEYYNDMTACLQEVNALTKGKGGTTKFSGVFRPEAEHNPFESEFEINMRNACMENKGWRIGTDEGKFLPFN